MADIAHVGATPNEAAGAATTITATRTITAGNAYVFFVSIGSNATVTASDGQGSLTACGSVYSSTANQKLVAFLRRNATGGSTTATASFTSSDSRFCWIEELSNAALTGGDNGSAAAEQNSPGTGTDALTSGNPTVTNQPAMIVSVCMNVSGNQVASAGTAFTSRGTSWSSPVLAVLETKRVTTTTGDAGTFTVGSGGGTNRYITLAVVVDEASTAQTLSPSAIATAEAFGTLSLALFITPSGVASLEAFGTATLVLFLLPSSIASLEAFGTPALVLYLVSTGIASAEAFGSATVTTGNVDVAPASIAGAESFGTPTLDITVAPTSIATAEALGDPAVMPGAATVAPAAIASAETFGNASLGLYLSPAALTSAEAIGDPTVSTGAISIAAEAVTSAEGFGTATLTLSLSPSAVASLEAFGTSTLVLYLAPAAVASAEDFGTTTVNLGSNQGLTPASIATAEAFGNHTLATGSVTLSPTGVDSAEAHGLPSLALDIMPSQITTTQAFGGAIVETGSAAIAPAGIASLLAFGVTVLTGGADVEVPRAAVSSGHTRAGPKTRRATRRGGSSGPTS